MQIWKKSVGGRGPCAQGHLTQVHEVRRVGGITLDQRAGAEETVELTRIWGFFLSMMHEKSNMLEKAHSRYCVKNNL